MYTCPEPKLLHSCPEPEFIIMIIMDPTGVFIVYDYFYIFFIQEDTVDMRAGEVGNLLYWPGLDPGILVL